MANAPSYDPRMENMPVLISYPRSGSNWLNAVMELYFDRPRLRVGPTTFLKDINSRTDFMWFHDHDITSKLVLSHDDILYLYRDPCDVIFSLLMAEHSKAMSRLAGASVLALVENQIELINKHYEKYLKYTSIRYEDCKEDFPKEFETILRFFGRDGPADRERLARCVDMVRKADLVAKATDKRYFNKSMMDKEYEAKRSSFRQFYGELIYSRLDR